MADYDIFLSRSLRYNEDAGTMSMTMEHQLNSNALGIAESISDINTMAAGASKGVNDVAEKNTDIVTLTNNAHKMSNENAMLADSLKEMIGKFRP